MDGLEKLESNGVTAYIDPGLREFLDDYGDINLDYVTREVGRGGYLVSVGKKGGNNCGSCSC